MPAGVAATTDTIPGTAWTTRDWEVFQEKVRWGAAHRLDTLPIGAALVRLGRTFVDTPYRPGTLEVPGPERLVIDLRELDCVTLVENVIALTWFVRRDGVALLATPNAARARYESHLRDLRYRDGRLEGYASRLHYFSEWLADHERRGLLKQISRELGGVADRRPIDFMSSHPASYRQLQEPGVREAIQGIEAKLNAAGPRWYLPKARIAAVASRIHDGDIIAATATVAGLDVVHTGIAFWQDGVLHLLHAPLVGKSVEISTQSLAERILSIKSQSGIMVARLEDHR